MNDRPTPVEKNLLLLSCTGIGEREARGAPTFWKTLERYVSDGWQVWVINAHRNNEPPREKDYGDGLHLSAFSAPFRKAARIRIIGRLFDKLCTWAIGGRLLLRAKSLMEREGLSPENTVVYASDVYTASVGARLRSRGFPLVTRFYGVWDGMSVPDTLGNRIRQYPRLQAYGTPADLIIMTNDGTRGDELLRRMKNDSPMVFWRNGVDIPAESYPVPEKLRGLSAEDTVLITVSRLQQGKRIDRSVRALAEAVKEFPHTKLVICGQGAERPRLEELCRALHVEEHVIFTGEVPHSEIFSYIRQADIFLSFYEASNLGNPIFEAMRCGLAIITSDAGATDTVVKNGVNGILLPTDDLERTIPETLLSLLRNPAERERLARGARQYAAENFRTWDERLRDETEAVEALLHRKSR